jgi:hypothetical protein
MYKVIFNYQNRTMFKYYKSEQKVIDCIKSLTDEYQLICVVDMTNGEEVEFDIN